MKNKTWLYVIYTVICYGLYSFISLNYSGSLKVNTILFAVLAVMLLFYIPCTIWLSLSKYRSKKDCSYLVIGIWYSLLVLFAFFTEINQYIDFVQIMGIV